MLKRIKFNKLKRFLKKLPKTLGEQAFLTFFVLFLLSSILGILVFYKYSILVQKTELKVLEKPTQFDEILYQEILKIWQDREKIFQETESKKYPDPFQGTTSSSEEELTE